MRRPKASTWHIFWVVVLPFVLTFAIIIFKANNSETVPSAAMGGMFISKLCLVLILCAEASGGTLVFNITS